MGQIRAFIAALQFLTRLPLHWIKADIDDFGRGMFYFPFVGLIVGFLTGSVYYSLLFLPKELAAALTLLFLVVITGGLHWDGMLDTLDAVFSARDRDKMLEIMKDSRVGAHGVTGAVLLLLLKYTLLLSLPLTVKGSLLIPVFAVINMLAYGNMAAAISLFPYAREKGLGTFFREKGSSKQLTAASLLSVIAAYFLLGSPGILLVLASVLFMFAFGRGMTALLGGLTGDVYGALCELEEIWLLLFLIVFLNIIG